jgi:small subunit ribosomal protein S20
LANTKQSKKRARQSEKRRIHNHSRLSAMRTCIKKLLQAVQAGDKTAAQASYIATSSIIDKLAKKGYIHKNKAARHKSRLTAKLKAIA